MEQDKRIANKKNLAEYRAKAPELTDERLTAIIEDKYPKRFLLDDTLDLVIRRLYKDYKELNEESFASTLKAMVKNGQLSKYDREEIRWRELHIKSRNLVEKIYKDACEREVYLSQYPEWDDELAAYFETLYQNTDKTLAQKFYTLFCNYQFSGYPPFHTYTEPNGDLIFTKEKRTLDSYPLEVREGNILKEMNKYCSTTILVRIGERAVKPEYAPACLDNLSEPQRIYRVKLLERLIAMRKYENVIRFDAKLNEGDYSELGEVSVSPAKSTDSQKELKRLVKMVITLLLILVLTGILLNYLLK